MYKNDFYLFTVANGKQLDNSVRVSLSSRNGALTVPKVKTFSNIVALNAHVSNFERWSGLTVVFDVMAHQNVGHALFDGLFPAFLALRKFGLQSRSFRFWEGEAGLGEGSEGR